VSELAVEELARLLVTVHLGMERCDHALVAMESAQIGEVALCEPAPDQAPRDDRAGL